MEANLAACVAAQKPIVIGTTGLEERHHWLIDDAAQDIAVLQTGNTSLGVTMLAALVKEAASRLGSDWDIEIVEMHHRMKVDAPSGTAILLGEAAAAGRHIDLASSSERGRDGITGARKEGAIGFASLRGGTVAATIALSLPAMKKASPCRTGPKTGQYLRAARSRQRFGCKARKRAVIPCQRYWGFNFPV